MSDAAARSMARSSPVRGGVTAVDGRPPGDAGDRERDAELAYAAARAEGKSATEAARLAYEASHGGPGTWTEHKGPDLDELRPGAMVVADWIRANRGAERKAALVVNAAGELLVPQDLQSDILSLARTAGLIRSLVEPVDTDRLRPRVALLGDAVVGWSRWETGGAVTDANVVPTTPSDIPVHDLTALAQLGEDLLADTNADELRRSLASVFGTAVAEAEDAAFANGNGTTQPKGLAHADVIAAIPAGQKITAAAPPTIANLRALPWRLPARYRRNAAWLMSTDASEAVAGLTGTGGDLVYPEPGPGGRGLLGWPAYEVPGLPAMTGTNAPSILFGDIAAAYKVEDRQRLSLRDVSERWAELGLVGVVMRHRVGGQVIRPAALAAYLL